MCFTNLLRSLTGFGRFGEVKTGDARFEVDRFRRKEGREIKPLTVREILDEELTSKA
jgi:hypothetical protein